MRKFYLSILSVAIATLFTACSDDDVAVASSVLGAPVSITTEEGAENTIASLSSLSSVQSIGSTPTTSIARTISMAKSMSSSRAPSQGASLAPFSYTCSNGGTMNMTGDQSNFSYTYNNCLMDTITYNGSISASANTFVMNFSTSDSSTSPATTASINISMSGTDSDMTITGTMSYVDPIDSVSVGYQNFHFVENNDNTIEISGQISVSSTQYSCANGSFTIATPAALTPSSAGGYSAGTMTVNGATFVFNANGTADVTLADGSTNSKPKSTSGL